MSNKNIFSYKDNLETVAIWYARFNGIKHLVFFEVDPQSSTYLQVHGLSENGRPITRRDRFREILADYYAHNKYITGLNLK